MKRLSGYRFGKIEVDGIPYREDLWICGEQWGHWWRKESHRVYPEDLQAILDFSPEAVIIGTGFFAMLQVTPEAAAFLSSRGVELYTVSTQKAIDLYNELAKRKRVAVFLHLTC